jgi:hypothetical protein
VRGYVTGAQPSRVFRLAESLANVRVNLDLNNLPVKDALKQVFDQAKREYVLDADVPDDKRVTVRAADVPLNTALDLITGAAGVRWGQEIKDGKAVIRVGKNAPRSLFAAGNLATIYGNGMNALDLARQGDLGPLIYRFGTTERRSTFTCPHCKGQATVLRASRQPRCAKCDRVFQSSWQFCPQDGTKRPAAAGAWKFCPICGKPVAMDSTTTDAPAGVNLLAPDHAQRHGVSARTRPPVAGAS